jgi:hypothetical protein
MSREARQGRSGGDPRADHGEPVAETAKNAQKREEDGRTITNGDWRIAHDHFNWILQEFRCGEKGGETHEGRCGRWVDRAFCADLKQVAWRLRSGIAKGEIAAAPSLRDLITAIETSTRRVEKTLLECVDPEEDPAVRRKGY